MTYMKIRPLLAAASAVLLIAANTFSVYAASADGLPETLTFSQDNVLLSDMPPSEEWETVTSGDHFPSPGDSAAQEPSGDNTENPGITVPDEAPPFRAHIEYSPQGYVVIGTFTEFLPNTSLVQPLYSLDGETWQTCSVALNLEWLSEEIVDKLEQLRNWTYLHDAYEPLAGYLAGQLDRFYLKLRITLENEITYETQAAVIDRGDPQPLPEELHPVAGFVPAMLIRQWRPFKRYGQYQITVSDSTAPEDIFDLLPDTLPIEIQLYAGIDMATSATVDCPVTWKPLSLSRLVAGESVTIADAAEEIVVPAGTLLNTPNGIFQLNEPLGMEHDEINLVLNVVAEDADPTGALAHDISGLQLTFHLKPTGATAIRAYTLSKGEADWTELPGALLPEEVNAPTSAANSAYVCILQNTSEPYQSYLAAWNAQEEPAPFLVSLKIEGGVYDGRQLILACPDTYEFPAKLPPLNGSGGNECNAGSDNQNDSTSEGQRPHLPQNPQDKPDTQEPQPSQSPQDKPDTQEPQPSQNPQDKPDTQEPQPSQNPQDKPDTPNPQPSQNPQDKPDTQDPGPSQGSADSPDTQDPVPPQSSGNEQDTQKPELPQPPKYKPEAPQPAPHIPETKPEIQAANPQIPGEQQPELPPDLKEESKDWQTAPHRPLKDETDGYTAGKDEAEILSAMIAVDPASIPRINEKACAPARQRDISGTEYGLRRLLPTMAAIAAGICVAAAAGKMTAGKIARAIYRLFHLK